MEDIASVIDIPMNDDNYEWILSDQGRAWVHGAFFEKDHDTVNVSRWWWVEQLEKAVPNFFYECGSAPKEVLRTLVFPNGKTLPKHFFALVDKVYWG